MTFKKKQVFALIPARAGSKGVPRKNLRTVGGKPLVVYTIEAAIGSVFIDRVYVSSDDEDILKIARLMNVEPLKRSEDAACDTSLANMVVYDFIKQLPRSEVVDDPVIIYLQPTSPLRTSSNIDSAFCEMDINNVFQCVSVMELKKTPYKAFILSNEGLLKSLFDEELTSSNRQTLPTAYYPNGAMYIFLLSEFIKNGNFPSNGSLPFIMTEYESIDIDTEDDFVMMEKLCIQY
jgi:CMP-N,N'-diacetyllegionaminic acid synthase